MQTDRWGGILFTLDRIADPHWPHITAQAIMEAEGREPRTLYAAHLIEGGIPIEGIQIERVTPKHMPEDTPAGKAGYCVIVGEAPWSDYPTTSFPPGTAISTGPEGTYATRETLAPLLTRHLQGLQTLYAQKHPQRTRKPGPPVTETLTTALRQKYGHVAQAQPPETTAPENTAPEYEAED